MPNIFEMIKAVILGIVEGITEWLPISSTGHMILVDEIAPLEVSDDFKTLFLVVIQLGAILAVVILYWNKLWPFKLKRAEGEKIVDTNKMLLWVKILIASIPAAVIGLAFEKRIDTMLTDDNIRAYVVAGALIVYGILFIVIEKLKKKETVTDLNKLPYSKALYIGLIQCLSLVPGTSRSGSTILGASLLGTSRTVAAEFSFFLGIPAMFGASAMKLLKFFGEGNRFTTDELVILAIGCVVSFVVSILAIKFLVGYIKKHDFKVFGWYRIVLGIAVIAYFVLVK